MSTPEIPGMGKRLATLLREEIELRLANLHTGLPAKVTAVNTTDSGAAESVDVVPLLERKVLDEDMQEAFEAIPVITRVPYLSPVFGGWILHAAPKVDDLVYLTFAERSLDRWMSGQGQAVFPGAGRKHDLSDAVALGALTPWPGQAGAAARGPDDLYIGRADGSCFLKISPTGEVTIKASSVKLGEGATLGVARQTDEITVDDPGFLSWLQGLAAATTPPYAAPMPPVKGHVTSSSGKVTSE